MITFRLFACVRLLCLVNFGFLSFSLEIGYSASVDGFLEDFSHEFLNHNKTRSSYYSRLCFVCLFHLFHYKNRRSSPSNFSSYQIRCLSSLSDSYHGNLNDNACFFRGFRRACFPRRYAFASNFYHSFLPFLTSCFRGNVRGFQSFVFGHYSSFLASNFAGFHGISVALIRFPF